jgi:hypothetical protein
MKLFRVSKTEERSVPAFGRDEAGRGHASLDAVIDGVRNKEQGQQDTKYERVDVHRDARNLQSRLVLVEMK